MATNGNNPNKPVQTCSQDAQTTWENPTNTMGFAFVEFATSDPKPISALFEAFGFTPVAHDRDKPIIQYQQGDITFFINSSPEGFAAEFAAKHGPCCCSIGFKVKDAAKAMAHAYRTGAEEYTRGNQSFSLPTLTGVGGSLIYLVDDNGKHFFEKEFAPIGNPCWENNVGLTYIDHLTHNVYRGNMDSWAEYYERVFNFREIRYFDIKGQHTGLLSRAMTSPCGKIRIPINESTDDQSQIEEYIRDYNGEGIQHIALGTDDIYTTIETLRQRNIQFMTVPDSYYEAVDSRLQAHGEDLDRLCKNRILIDGETTQDKQKILLQIFTNNCIGPIFFEIIQRKGDHGFGEGNFQALFESIEIDQVRRGIIKHD